MNLLSLLQPISLAAASPAEALDPEFVANEFEAFSQNALFVVVDIGMIAIVASILLCIYRLLRGPSLIDRGLAADTISVQVIGLVILLTVRLQTLMLFDAVLIVAILGFVSTIAFAQFIGRRRAAQ